MLVAAKNARFIASYVKIGLTPDGGLTSLMSEFVSRQVLNEICMFGSSISSERMYSLGVVNRLVEPGLSMATAIGLGQKLATGPQRAIARIKVLCRRAGNVTLDEQLGYEAMLMAESQGDMEFEEGISAFFEKRAPNFTGIQGTFPTPDVVSIN